MKYCRPPNFISWRRHCSSDGEMRIKKNERIPDSYSSCFQIKSDEVLNSVGIIWILSLVLLSTIWLLSASRIYYPDIHHLNSIRYPNFVFHPGVICHWMFYIRILSTIQELSISGYYTSFWISVIQILSDIRISIVRILFSK